MCWKMLNIRKATTDHNNQSKLCIVKIIGFLLYFRAIIAKTSSVFSVFVLVKHMWSIMLNIGKVTTDSNNYVGFCIVKITSVCLSLTPITHYLLLKQTFFSFHFVVHIFQGYVNVKCNSIHIWGPFSS